MAQSETFVHRALIMSKRRSEKGRRDIDLLATSARQSQKEFLKGGEGLFPGRIPFNEQQ